MVIVSGVVVWLSSCGVVVVVVVVCRGWGGSVLWLL